MIFFNSKNEEKLIELNKRVSESFSLVKQDKELLFKWIDYLYSVVQNQQRMLERLNEKVSVLASTPQVKQEEVKRIVDMQFSQPLNNIMDHIRVIENKVHHFELQKLESPIVRIQQIRPVQPQTANLQSQAMPQVFEDKKSVLKNKILKNFVKNSKDYIKNVLLSLVQKYASISSLQLREIVVDEQSLCSRSSFYRLLEELEREDEVVVSHKGKEKIYAPKFEKGPKHHVISRR